MEPSESRPALGPLRALLPLGIGLTVVGWMVARAVWWAIGLANQAVAFTTGLTNSIVLAASGRRVPELEYDLLRLITDGPEF